MTNQDDKQALRKELAAIEHQRWSDWMEYMLDCAVKSGDDNIGIRTCGWPTAQFEHWQRQIETDYADLSDKEKASDMEQVDRYWHLIDAYTKQQVREARIDELKRITLTGTPNSIDTAVISVPEMADKGDVVFLSIEDRIKELKGDNHASI